MQEGCELVQKTAQQGYQTKEQTRRLEELLKQKGQLEEDLEAAGISYK